MEILAIDPGSKQSAFVIYNGESRELVEFGILPNEELVLRLDEIIAEVMVIEQIKSYGMPIGDTVLDTVLWSGRFIQAWSFRWERIPRKTIATELCGSPRSNDRNCRLELLNLWGGKSQAVGTKKRPGALYGLKNDMWQALAVAYVWYEREKRVIKLMK